MSDTSLRAAQMNLDTASTATLQGGSTFDGADFTKRRRRANSGRSVTARLVAGAVVVATAFGLAACQHSDSRSYDIGPIFPLSADKCAKYDGKAEGSGLTAHCWVTKSECERAAADWRQAMQNIPDALNFTCDG